MRLFGNANYKFIEKRRTAYLVSGIAIAAGIAAMVFNVATIGSWQNYGVDFTGGSLVQVHFEEDHGIAAVRDALGGASGPGVTGFEGVNEYVIRAPLDEGASVDAVRSEIQEQLAAAFGEGSFEISRTELVGPKIGAELQQKAVLAILLSFGLTLIYLAIRFELRFGLASLVASIHDILLVLGFLALFRVEVSLPTVAAILTILGYSLNDTIVVFDRIRENMNQRGARKLDQIELIDRSINETLPRTVMTSATTASVLLALLLVGPAAIRDFANILLVGVIVGTYSSIFVASPALVEIRKWLGEKDDRKKKSRPRTASV